MRLSVIMLLLGLCWLSVVNGKPRRQHKKHVYSFGYGIENLPFMDVNSDNQLYGFNYEVVNAICKVMNKICTHTVYYDYTKNCWDEDYASPALNNGWWDVCVGYMETSIRASVYGFLAPITHEPDSHVYVRANSSMTSLDDLDQDAVYIGFVAGWWTDQTCLDKIDNINVGNKAKDQYKFPDKLKDALVDGEVDAIFAPEENIGEDDRLKQLSSSPITCANAGTSMMMRKDRVYKYEWMKKGLKKIKDNGHYATLCTNAESDGDPRCL